MNKTVKYILWILAVILGIMLSSCKSEEPISKNKNELITIHVGMPAESETRVVFDDGKLKLTWEEGDKLVVIGVDNNDKEVGKAQEYELISGFGTASGTFQGKPIPGADYYRVFYKTDYDISLKRQKQLYNNLYNNSTEHMKRFLAFGNEKVEDLTVPFKLQLTLSIMKIVMTNIPQMDELAHLQWLSIEDDDNQFLFEMDFDNIALSSSKNAFTAYFCFYPSADKDIKKGSKVQVMLEGISRGSKKKYVSQIESSNGKDYISGRRYTLKLSEWKEE